VNVALTLGLGGRGGGGGAGEAAAALYRAPEQLVGQNPDARADVYAVGALLYEMVTGAPPHAGSPDPVARKRTEPVQSPRMFRPEMPLELERLILSALDRDPAARPPTMAAFLGTLESLTQARESAPDGDDEAGAAAPPSPERRRARREAAFRAIGELLSAPPLDEDDNHSLLPSLLGGPPVPSDDEDSRPTPLRGPSLDLVAATGPPRVPADAAAPEPAPAAPSSPWEPPAPTTPSAPTAAGGFGGALLARYGAEPGDPGRWRSRIVMLVVGGVAAIVTAALLLAR
jgi:serine/threonine protein kinase